MTRHWAILCFLILALAAQEIKGSSLKTLSNAWASNNGEVPINKDSNGFYVDVDLSYYPSSTSNTSKMLLGLSNAETIFTYNCAGFNWFYCNQHNCTEYKQAQSNIDFPSFSTSATWAKIEAHLDYSSWEVRTTVYIAQNCKAGSNSFGTGRGGILGMGNNPGSWQNYLNSTTFSFNFEKNLASGKLLFRDEPSLHPSETALTITTDFNYIATFSNGYLKVATYTNYFSGKLIFDIHANAIGLPLVIFDGLISYLSKSQNITCYSDKTNPRCNFYGYLKDLPTLKLSIGSAIIDLPPEVYVKNPTSDYVYSITLNLQATSPLLTGSNYVSYSFNDAIIMDAQFMSYYYVVFERYRVKLYGPESPPTPTPSPSSNPLGFIILGLVGFSIITAICCCIFKKNKKTSAPISLPSQEPSYNPIPPVQPNNGYVYPPQNSYPVVQQQYAQQPTGYVQQQQPGYYQPPIPQQQYQQPGYVGYNA